MRNLTSTCKFWIWTLLFVVTIGCFAGCAPKRQPVPSPSQTPTAGTTP